MPDSTTEAQADNSLELNDLSCLKSHYFQKGQVGGPGRPKHLWNQSTKKAVFRRAIYINWKIMQGNIVDSYLDSKGKRIVVVENVQAVLQASKFLAEYAAGKPAQRIDLSISDDVERPNTLSIVLNRPATKEQRSEASRQIIELANAVNDDDAK